MLNKIKCITVMLVLICTSLFSNTISLSVEAAQTDIDTDTDSDQYANANVYITTDGNSPEEPETITFDERKQEPTDYYHTKVYKSYLPSGTIRIDYAMDLISDEAADSTSLSSVSVSIKSAINGDIVTSANDWNSVSMPNKDSKTSAYSTSYFGIKKAGYYYIVFSSFLRDFSAIRVSFSAKYYRNNVTISDGTKDLMIGSTGESSYDSNDGWSFLKFTAPSNGKLSLYASSINNNQIYFRISKDAKNSWYEDYASVINSTIKKCEYEVKKGTFYVGVASGCDIIKLSSSFTPSKISKCSSKKSNATYLKAGKTVNGAVYANSSDASWYKIVIKKEKAICIKLNNKCYEQEKTYSVNKIVNCLQISMYKKKKSYSNYASPGEINKFYPAVSYGMLILSPYNTHDGTLPAGTYYIKISKAIKNQGAEFTLSYK